MARISLVVFMHNRLVSSTQMSTICSRLIDSFDSDVSVLDDRSAQFLKRS